MTKGWVCRKTYATTRDYKADNLDGILKTPAVQNTHFMRSKVRNVKDIKSTYISQNFVYVCKVFLTVI